MKHIVVSTSEWTYPDVFHYASASQSADLHAARNSYAAAQIILSDVPEEVDLAVSVKGELASYDFNWYEMVPVYVEDNPHLNKDNALPNYPNRWAPFYIYDCVKPLQDKVTPMDGASALYFTIRIESDAQPGIVSGEIEISIGQDVISFPISVTIYTATVPVEENLKIINGYNMLKTAEYHKVDFGSEEHNQLNIKYLKMLRYMRQNMLYTPGAGKTCVDGKGKYTFDFTEMIDFIKMTSSLGYKYFFGRSIGRRKSWKQSTILVGPNYEFEAMGHQAYNYLSQYLTQLRKVLVENGWLDRFYLGVSDEPNEANATEYRALCGLIKKFFPDVKLMDAMSYGHTHGAIDAWIPLNSEYDKHQVEFESYRSNGDELWHYVCCGPRYGGYINRFMDYPLLSTRYLFWGNYKYSLVGYLHWAANYYQPYQDPFVTNCPLHRNTDSQTILPPGDSHIIYPGEGEPWMSMRLEAHREGAEDFELLRLISLTNKDLADSLCHKAFKSFKDVEYDPITFNNIRIEILKAASKC